MHVQFKAIIFKTLIKDITSYFCWDVHVQVLRNIPRK